MPDAEGAAEHSLTRASEDYLESIYRFSQLPDQDVEGVRSVDVAEDLGVSKASVNKALSVLKELGMVNQSRYGRVTLTSGGEAYAAKVWTAHRTLRTFLERELGVDHAVADAEACLLEHHLSDDTMRRFTAYLEDQGISVTD